MCTKKITGIFFSLSFQGSTFNSQPQRKLSQSFGLDLAPPGGSYGGSSSSSTGNKQSLLSTIGHIMASHGPYKRSPDAHFKALICAGLK